MVSVMECHGEYATRTIAKTETLYDRLHRTNLPNWNTDRLRMIQQLVRGLAVARQSNTTDQILTELSPHKIVVNDGNEVFLLMADTGPTYSKSYQPVFVASQNENGQVAQEAEIEQNDRSVKLKPKEHLPSHTPHSAEPETEQAASAGTDEERSTLTSSSMMMKANENVRWTPPEVTGRKSGVDKEKAAVFNWRGWRDADAEGVFGDSVACSAVHLAGPSDAADAGTGGVNTGLLADDADNEEGTVATKRSDWCVKHVTHCTPNANHSHSYLFIESHVRHILFFGSHHMHGLMCFTSPHNTIDLVDFIANLVSQT
ncbi:hypothetical protein BLNAU_9928 [Blattamonas nauphoetae]|uniref:Uncharacterized protein n=1 Tax=Blattamonas nauphoetae TaxID=2049346 RepID=A0ABQ9XUP2_9EUKA|nr:hypothetical protein BLNAU_9928 [Blattamonas nauphoetae]